MIKYKKALGAVLFKQNNEFVIVKSREVFKVNEVGARIFELCNENYNEQNIIEKLSKFYNTSEKEIEKDIKGFINEMLNMTVIKIIS
ncbi:PqqD family protein [Clostridium estertheticum]|uniref:PqqD family protein n=1 Tax=Clostridium estertheticum TaxID=238834 RepID=UPI00124F158A|nr:PqqD family protein [Clostridium estertheticum]MBZ9618258.1 PqqD family protein [Clostridium estertheticum subsp. laramiense]WAG76240.1 PqqD family protein [Clostridium estertheticum]